MSIRQLPQEPGCQPKGDMELATRLAGAVYRSRAERIGGLSKIGYPAQSDKLDAAEAGAATPGARDRMERYNQYLNDREDEKMALYTRVVSLGWVFTAASVVVACAAMALYWSRPGPDALYWIGLLFTLLAILGAVTGVSLISTVPTEEYDIDHQRERYADKWVRIQAGMAFVAVAAGFLFTTYFPFCSGWPNFLAAAMILFHGFNCGARWRWCTHDIPFTAKLSFVPVFTFLPMAGVAIMIGFSPDLLQLNLALPGLWKEWAAQLRQVPTAAGLVFGGQAAIYILTCLGLIARWYHLSRSASPPKGWRTGFFYGTFYAWILAAGTANLAANVTGVFVDGVIVRETIPFALAIIAVLFAPIFVVILVGRKRCFTLVARIFEFDVDRLKRDGSLMAELASKSTVIDEQGGSWWIFRPVPAARFASIESADSDLIKRSFWLRGRIVATTAAGAKVDSAATTTAATTTTTTTTAASGIATAATVDSGAGVSAPRLLVEVDMAEDVDVSWCAQFQGCEISFYRDGKPFVAPKHAVSSGMDLDVYSVARTRITDAAFDSWLKQWCVSRDVARIDKERKLVTLWVDVTSGQADSAELLDWATKNFRGFRWERFASSPDLLDKSPRKLETDAEKAEAYAFSEPMEVLSAADRVDFFVSHSWEDSSTERARALASFMESEQKANPSRAFRLWLDKVCINQANPGNALSVLPINVAMCKSMLVLMSPTYLTRLWCIWELFALFTFCYKELAVQRVRIAAVGGRETASAKMLISQLRKFNIDKAHCFGPNEEFKLRHIIFDIGVERFTETLGRLADGLELG